MKSPSRCEVISSDANRSSGGDGIANSRLVQPGEEARNLAFIVDRRARQYGTVVHRCDDVGR